MDLTKYRDKLVGSEDERAVSPVIGVILMVAITVILAAVIAAFVLDLGDDMNEGSVNAGVSEDVSDSEYEVTLTLNEDGDAEEFVLRGEGVEGDEVELDELEDTGSTTTLAYGEGLAADSGNANIIAISGDAESTVGSFEWDWSPSASTDVNSGELEYSIDYVGETGDVIVASNSSGWDGNETESEPATGTVDLDPGSEGEGVIYHENDGDNVTIETFSWDLS